MATEEEASGQRSSQQSPSGTSGTNPQTISFESWTKKKSCVRCQSPLPEDRFALCSQCDELREAEIELVATRNRMERIAANLARSCVPRAYAERERLLADVRNEKARALGQRVIDGDGPGLYIHGAAGDDKTTLMAACLVEWIRRDSTGMFVSALDLISDIQATNRDGSALTRNDLVKPLIDTPCLAIDDLGKEKASEYVAGVIHQILDGRNRMRSARAHRLLLITSNYSLDELCARFRDEKSAEPIRRRISEMTIALEMK